MSRKKKTNSKRHGRSHARQLRFVFLGAGSVGRELIRAVYRVGGNDFLLIDPKQYSEASVHSQCEPSEVGQLKVDVQAEWLRERGVTVTTYPRDLSSVPEGVLGDQTIAIASLDNRHAEISANRWVSRMRARLVKVNIEPQYGVAAVRCYDFRRYPELCVECQYSHELYAHQWHPRSCDAASRIRPTNSPGWLSRAAAEIGVTAIQDLVAERGAERRWLCREVLWTSLTGQFTESELTSRVACRWDHQQHWRDVVRCEGGRRTLTLRDAIAAAGLGPAPTRVRTCHPISLRSRCAQCGRENQDIRWLPDLNRSMPACPRCGGATGAIPFWNQSEIDLGYLQHVLDEPLDSWGVEPCAVFQFYRGRRAVAVVVGPAVTNTCPEVSSEQSSVD